MDAAQLTCKGNLYPPEKMMRIYGKIQCCFSNVPPSYFNKGTTAIAAKTVGIPMTTPENVEFPPR